MDSTILSFVNKNLFRRYPLQGNTSVTSQNGLILPDNIIANASISTIIDASNVYIQQAYFKNGFASVSICHYDSENPIALGCFTASIVEDLQEVRLTPYVPYADGYMIFGLLASLQQYTATLLFDYPNTIFEATTVFCFARPGVTSLIAKNISLTGNVELGSLNNILAISESNKVELQVSNTSSIESIADLSSAFGNCPTPVIYKINNTVPYTPDVTSANDYNIYLFGVSPLSFEPDSTTASINIISPGFSLSDLCAQSTQILAPINPNFLINRTADSFVGINRYYSKSQSPIINFYGEMTPEYVYWPYYVDNVLLSVSNPVTGSYSFTPPTLPLGAISGTISIIVFSVNTGSLTASFQISSNNIIPNTFSVTVEDLVLLPSVLAPSVSADFTPSDTFLVDVSSVTGTPTSLTATVIYTINYP